MNSHLFGTLKSNSEILADLRADLIYSSYKWEIYSPSVRPLRREQFLDFKTSPPTAKSLSGIMAGKDSTPFERDSDHCNPCS